MSEWVICSHCSLKHRPDGGICPRCEKPVAAGALVFGSHRDAPEPPTEASALAVGIPLGGLLATLGGFVFLGPLGGKAAGTASVGFVLGGLLLVCVAWAWAMTLAARVALSSFLFALFVPYVSAAVGGRWKPLSLQLVGTGLVVLGLVFAPVGFANPGRIHEVAQACESRAAEDCACIGGKVVELMTPEERAAPFDAESPHARDLMLTSGLLCRKERLVSRCAGTGQGSEVLCTCVMDAAVDAFTPTELDAALAQAISGNPPPRYAALQAACQGRLAPARR